MFLLLIIVIRTSSDRMPWQEYSYIRILLYDLNIIGLYKSVFCVFLKMRQTINLYYLLNKIIFKNTGFRIQWNNRNHLKPMNLPFSPNLIIYIGLGYKPRKQIKFILFLDFEKFQSNYTQLSIFCQSLVVAMVVQSIPYFGLLLAEIVLVMNIFSDGQ